MGGTMRMRLALCALAAAALIAGCGGSKSSSSSTKASSTTATTAPATTTPATAGGALPNMYRMPSPPPPHPGASVKELVVKDVRKGTGQEIHAGDTAIVEFVLSDYNSGRLIDKSWGKKRPYEVKIEKNVVIDGWWQGVPGMRVGGRRVLIIPPSLGFTNNPNPRVAGKTTYFDIVLLGIIRAQPGETPAQPGGAGQ
jgi:peptidylprolyl isomerase